MKPWGFLRTQSPARPAEDPSVQQQGYVSGAEASSMTDDLMKWSPDFRLLSLDDQVMEIVDHVRRLRSEVGTMRAEVAELREDFSRETKLPPYFRHKDQAGARGDMTKPRKG